MPSNAGVKTDEWTPSSAPSTLTEVEILVDTLGRPTDPTAPRGQALVGQRIRHFWGSKLGWFMGNVTMFDQQSGEHTVHFDDGDVEVYVLDNESWKLDLSPESSTLKGPEPRKPPALRRQWESVPRQPVSQPKVQTLQPVPQPKVHRTVRKCRKHTSPRWKLDVGALGKRLIVFHEHEGGWFPGKIASINDASLTRPYLVLYDDGAQHWHNLDPCEILFEWLGDHAAVPDFVEMLPSLFGVPIAVTLSAIAEQRRSHGGETLSEQFADGCAPRELSIFDLCDYNLEGYTTMGLDRVRNEFFAATLAAAPQGAWLEIGCGASAVLTRMLLRDSERTVVALEASEEAAAIAQRILNQDATLPPCHPDTLPPSSQTASQTANRWATYDFQLGGQAGRKARMQAG